jgi:DNA processing protein
MPLQVQGTPQELFGPLDPAETMHAPARLFAAGDVGLLRQGARVAIVGSRRASAGGLRRARKLAAQLARQGVIVVSGLAAGIDAAAHQATLAAGGRTIAVLGTPLDRVYPSCHRQLQQRIMADHLALTQFAPGAAVVKSNFPCRNRLMALIAHATVIIEAGDASGALAQGWEALRLGRLLFIPQSTLEDAGLTWPRRMLHHGAQALTATSSVTRLLPMLASPEIAQACLEAQAIPAPRQGARLPAAVAVPI